MIIPPTNLIYMFNVSVCLSFYGRPWIDCLVLLKVIGKGEVCALKGLIVVNDFESPI